ncbi:hypothetical protein WR25_26681 isoform B [Diploscapter pachys]|uniref:Rab-GAP TBC domain-containing protein n=1 Tax=Diploscapter pachys TaxID=2018661 RepID=A0A2A2L8P4_9BILA|nr:hypothetical protein WR25_26681 isoform A [Diploscapter pachys]PAV82543.1 hypothetical protein WR25_26681 isoform B [Diploscapter pachys]
MSLFTLRELFFLWKLCGANVETILLKNDVIRLSPPVMTLPNVIVEELRLFGNEKGRHFYTSRAVFTLPDSNLVKKFESIDASLLLPSIELDGPDVRESNETIQSSIVKEKNVSYQAFRMIFVKKLLNAGPFKQVELRKTVQFDIPPMLRSRVWPSLLKIRPSDTLDYDKLDTESEHVADRQLALDIPRCHQYDDLMCSPSAHDRLKRLVKAWLLTHPQYVYWQGCDSLAAPFMILNFENLALGHACMTAFIKKYLHNFFLKDNSAIIHEYLTVFAHLLAYVDAELLTHLSEMDFIPELYAIPWFLTCFAHVLPLHKLFHLWDVLLLHDSSFPIFVGLAIMRQLRPSLITATFNDAILLFSDLPDLSLSRVVADSLHFYSKVPPSCSFREHKGPSDGKRILKNYIFSK